MKKKPLINKSPERLSIREMIGASQEFYAGFCGISKSMLSMIEIRKRDWPISKGDSEIALAFIEAEKMEMDFSEYEQLKPYEVNDYEQRYLKLKGDVLRLEKGRKKNAFSVLQAKRMLKTCKVLRQKSEALSPFQMQTIELWETLAKNKLEEKRQIDLDILDLQIAGLKKQLEVLEQALARKL